jgi:hypothetical protein
MGCIQKSFKLVWRCHQFLSEFLEKGYLPRISRQSRLSAHDKGNNEMIPGTVHRSHGIYFTAEENSGKLQLGTVDEGCATNDRLKCGPLLPNDVNRNAQYIREGEGRK